jgi:uncharacterized membrane protein (DUF441 family)
MTRTQHNSKEQARSRGAEGQIVLALVLGGVIAVAAFAGAQVVHLIGGIGHALP